MNVYQAFLAAADFIEQNPNRYNYVRCTVPDIRSYGHEGTGCMWGWAAHFYGIPAGKSFRALANVVYPDYNMVMSPMEDRLFVIGAKIGFYTVRAEAAAQAMREFAETELKERFDIPEGPKWEPAYLTFKQHLLSRPIVGTAAALLLAIGLVVL